MRISVLLFVSALASTNAFNLAAPNALKSYKYSSSISANLLASPSWSVVGFRQSRRPTLMMSSSPADTPPSNHPVASLIADCKDFGLARFIVVHPGGSVLETAAPMNSGMKFFDIPGKGKYLTLASEDKLFEFHVNMDKVHVATLSQEAAKMGGHQQHVLRLKAADGTILLSCLLQYDPARGPGNYFPGAVEAFEAVLRRRGPEVRLA